MLRIEKVSLAPSPQQTPSNIEGRICKQCEVRTENSLVFLPGVHTRHGRKNKGVFRTQCALRMNKSCLVVCGVYMATGKHIAFAHAADMDVPSAAALGTFKSFNSSEN